ncbi:FHA domain-containing protein [Candidatus Saccharibacteria bacterium]|nr:FHA domain-containing protein [Candidatus Saccharibacteria bacterium]
MSEQTHPHIVDQKLGEDTLTTVELAHGETAKLALGSYIEGNQAVETGNGYNGDVVALFELPGTEEEPAKQIALMDFGEIDPNDPPSLLYYKGKPMTHIFGRVQSRYGLVAHNYSPSDHMRAYVPLEIGQPANVGRKTELSHDLGLDENERGTEAISRNHFSIQIGEDGEATIDDHSKNGTRVTFAESEKPAESLDDRAERLKEKLASIEEPFDPDTRANLHRYASNTLGKKEAQAAGDGQASTEFGQYAGQALLALPEEAKAVKDEYLRTLSQLEKVQTTISGSEQ